MLVGDALSLTENTALLSILTHTRNSLQNIMLTNETLARVWSDSTLNHETLDHPNVGACLRCLGLGNI